MGNIKKIEELIVRRLREFAAKFAATESNFKVPSKEYLWVLGIFLLVWFGLCSKKGNSIDNTDLASGTNNFTQSEIPQKTEPIKSNFKKLNYKIVHEIKNRRYDGGSYFFVLIDKVNLSDSSLKDKVKSTVDDIVNKKGKNISINFIDNRQDLELLYKSHYGTDKLGRILSKDELDRISLSSIADFHGELETAQYFNSIDFFPMGSDDNRVKHLEETGEYNPE